MSNLFEKLKEPFPKEAILWRLGATGGSQGNFWCLPLAYVDSRAVQRRLDDILGAENWSNKFHDVNGGICCELSIRIDGEWYMKSDGAGQTEIDPEKGGFSGALKRAASMWGVGRYLYDLDTGFAKTSKDKKAGWNKAKAKDGTQYWWQEPQLPPWALPGGVEDAQRFDPDKTITRIKNYLKGCKTPADVQELAVNEKESVAQLPAIDREELKALFETKKGELTQDIEKKFDGVKEERLGELKKDMQHD